MSQNVNRRHAAAARSNRQLRIRSRRAIASGIAIGAVAIGAFGGALTLPQASAAVASPTVTFTPLTLVNGWQVYPKAGGPAVADIAGIVTLRGTIQTNGTNPVAFRLPRAFRPATNVYLATALCGAAKGRLWIAPTGIVTVQSEGPFSAAKCAAELDGLSFARSAASFTPLKLQNGWQNSPFGTSKAAVRLISGTVHFKGAIRTSGTSTVAFTLPKGFRPAATVYLPVDLCNANKGRLYIRPTGVVHVYAENNFADAACFTSLDGATFATSAASFTAQHPINGWHYYGGGTYKPAARVISGIVQLKGTVSTGSGNNNLTFLTLPKGMRPSAPFVYVEVDLCSGTNGRLYIQHNGAVFVYAEGGVIQNARCFTSLDGAWFAR